ncbi:hypothetical protein Cs7R123_49220 [Catellatospora sp. TT07R-123]|uniref:hypothetical protein n=1 Tax=Catellatospora sp. TT07R-123 TaxID=2733863 RepID=UPI001B2E2326|nr:hypothetical protein [Catellatospora sp. TT07R-123]GHJ47580.1 hypothetical protein Cs7R123_49220 [Catellatospora sp. TT07R-123]
MEAKLFASLACARTRQPGVGRFDLVNGAYVLIGTSRQRPGSAAPMQADGLSYGDITIGDRYSGCPGCGADSFAQCGQCKRLACCNSGDRAFRCPSCGAGGQLEPGAIRLDGITAT